MLDSGELLSGRYRLEELLGRGGMGEVWRAADLRLGRTVAIKACISDDQERFSAEARVMASLHHPGIVNIYDYGDSFLVMEFVDGQPLSQLLDERGRLDSATTARITSQVAEALEVVHEAGIVHRDVKPGNILVDSNGNAKLTDFGVAASCGDGDSVLGTARYMAPEQAMGYTVTPAADIYALGAVAYHCVAGFPPFGGEDALQIALHHIQDVAPPLPRSTAPILRKAIERAMAKDPAGRFPSAAALAAALPSNPDTTMAMESFEPRGPRRGKLVTFAAAAALAGAGALMIGANLDDPPASPTPGQPPPAAPAAPASEQPSPTTVVTAPAGHTTPTPVPSRKPATVVSKTSLTPAPATTPPASSPPQTPPSSSPSP